MSNLDHPAFWEPDADPNHPIIPGMTIRQHAALTLRVPMSGDAELDAMIREARRLDMATAAMQGQIAGVEGLEATDVSVGEVSAFARLMADALLAASEPKKAEPCDCRSPSACRVYGRCLDKPQPDAEGWIEWHGGECPVRLDTCVEIRCRNGERDKSIAGQFYWKDDGDDCAIVAYRVVK